MGTSRPPNDKLGGVVEAPTNTMGSVAPRGRASAARRSASDVEENLASQNAADAKVEGSIASSWKEGPSEGNPPVFGSDVTLVTGNGKSRGVNVSDETVACTSLPTKTSAFAWTVVLSELATVCACTNTLSES